MTQHTDLAPTLLEYFDLDVPEGMQGHSLWPALHGENWQGNDAIYLTEATWEAKWGIRTAEWKLIKAVASGVHGIDWDELYHVSEDPEEAHNVIDSHPEVRDALELNLDRWREAMLATRPDPVRLQAVQGVPAEQWFAPRRAR
jgi:arylsulfatase A-like enzyme